MPVLKFPSSDNKVWTISYFSELVGDIIEGFNLNLTDSQGRVGINARVYPFTSSDDIAALTTPTDFSYNNSSGSTAYWTVASKVFTTANILTQFAADAISSSPTTLVDADIAVLQRNLYGYDVMIVTMPNDLAKLEKTTGSAAWIVNWWTGVAIGAGASITGTLNNTSSFVGSGLNDALYSGTYTGSGNKDYIVKISTAAGTDKFDWSDDGGTNYTTGVSITGSAQTLSNGVKITFAATTGHTLADEWHYSSRGFNTTYPVVAKSFNRLLIIGNDNYLHSINPTVLDTVTNQPTVQYQRLIFQSDYYVKWISTTKDRIFIGLTNKRDRNLVSQIVDYDPISESARTIDVQEGETIGFNWNNNCNIVDVVGNIREYTGTVFNPYAYFPNALNTSLGSFSLPHRNGIAIIGGYPNFLISIGANNYADGIWTYDPINKRLYHRVSLTFSTSTAKDYGAYYGRTSVGGLFSTSGYSFSSYFAGARIYKTNLGSLYAVFSEIRLAGPTERRGYFVTSKISSSEIDNIWKHLFLKYESSPTSLGIKTGTFIVKYRTSNPVYISDNGYQGAWTAATTFTIAASSWPSSGVVVGDEIFVTRGDGAGGAAHILSITGTTTLTITLDEAIISSPSGNFNFIIANWKKLSPTLTDNTINGSQVDLPAAAADWLQLKVEIRERMLLEELQIGYSENLKLEPTNQ